MPHRPPPAAAEAARRPLVLATGNAGKLRELQTLLDGLAVEVVPQARFGIDTPPETGVTFLANALQKARFAAAASGCTAIADDSGLEVDALGGAPGVYSARYAGPAADDAANNLRLMEALAKVPDSARTARYRCVLVCVTPDPSVPPLVAEGVWEGRIAAAPAGTGGFGYDPLFWLPALGVTVAQLPPAEKNRLSHRGQALARLRDQIAARFGPA